MRLKETEIEGGYAQWFKEAGVTIRIQTNKAWDELDLAMKNWYVEKAEEYFRVRHHTDLGKVEL